MRFDSSSEKDVMTFWYLRSTGDQDTHRGHLRRGRVLAGCGVEFSPLRTRTSRGLLSSFGKGSRSPALPGEPSNPVQVCPECYRASLSGEPSPILQAQALQVDRLNAVTDEDRQLLLELRRMTDACGAFCAGVIGSAFRARISLL